MPLTFTTLPIELQDQILKIVFEDELTSQVEAYADARGWMVAILAIRPLPPRRHSTAIEIAQLNFHWFNILTKTLDELVQRRAVEYGDGWERGQGSASCGLNVALSMTCRMHASSF